MRPLLRDPALPREWPGDFRGPGHPVVDLAPRELFENIPAQDFGPLQLKAVHQVMVESALCRNEVNTRTRRLIRVVGWVVEELIVPPQVHWGLKAVKGLKKGRSGVRETEPIHPVPDAFVDAIRAFVPPQV